MCYLKKKVHVFSHFVWKKYDKKVRKKSEEWLLSNTARRTWRYRWWPLFQSLLENSHYMLHFFKPVPYMLVLENELILLHSETNEVKFISIQYKMENLIVSKEQISFVFEHMFIDAVERKNLLSSQSGDSVHDVNFCVWVFSSLSLPPCLTFSVKITDKKS